MFICLLCIFLHIGIWYLPGKGLFRGVSNRVTYPHSLEAALGIRNGSFSVRGSVRARSASHRLPVHLVFIFCCAGFSAIHKARNTLSSACTKPFILTYGK